MGVMVLLDLMGGVALLLWGLHLVHSGLVRAFGADLRRFLRVALGHRVAAFFAGVGVTALLQSSTATALMITSFSAEGMLGLVSALAVMLGANVGTTLVVQALSFDVAGAAPVFLVAGVWAFRRGNRSITRDLGRRHRPRADAACAAHSGGKPRAGGERAARARRACGHHQGSLAVRADRRGPQLVRALERRRGAARDVARLFA